MRISKGGFMYSLERPGAEEPSVPSPRSHIALNQQ